MRLSQPPCSPVLAQLKFVTPSFNGFLSLLFFSISSNSQYRGLRNILTHLFQREHSTPHRRDPTKTIQTNISTITSTMHNFISPFPSLRRQRQTSDTSSSPSSRTTSPPSSPTATQRPFQSQPLPNNLFNLTFHPTHRNEPLYTEPGHIDVQNHDFATNSNFTTPHCGVVLPCAVLRGRSSMMVVRRRPSAIDLALSEERSRCTCDAIERQGLDLMEPRPVDMDLHAQAHVHARCPAPASPQLSSRASTERNSMQASSQQSPRFVMGGIFEVMEGRA